MLEFVAVGKEGEWIERGGERFWKKRVTKPHRKGREGQDPAKCSPYSSHLSPPFQTPSCLLLTVITQQHWQANTEPQPSALCFILHCKFGFTFRPVQTCREFSLFFFSSQSSHLACCSSKTGKAQGGREGRGLKLVREQREGSLQV